MASSLRSLKLVLGCLTIFGPAVQPTLAAEKRPDVAFLKKQCFDCHQGPEAVAGLDLAALATDLSDAAIQKRWVRIFDRIDAGEMPPPDAAKIPSPDRTAFLKTTGDWLRAFQRSQDERLG